MYTRAKKQRKSRAKYAAITLAALILLAGGGFLAYSLNKPSGTGKTGDAAGISGPTEQELEETERRKQEIAKELEESSGDRKAGDEQEGDKKQVEPVITSWGKNDADNTFEFRGFVPSIVEAGGSCTITLTRSGHETVTKTEGATENASNTSCGLMSVPYDALAPGTWQAILSYSSDSSEGASKKTDVEVD